MSQDYSSEIQKFMGGVLRRNPQEPEFHQSVQEAAQYLIPFIQENARYRDQFLLERLTEPDRIIIFRVTWEDDQGNIRADRGFRVQFNNAIGPYKGGLRFHPEVNRSVLKFLAFEQVFKNSLTGLPMGGAKGGSNFNPKEKSEREVMRFCQAFMTELSRYIGKDIDIPSGDIGVGTREIGYLFGQHKRLNHEFVPGTITGKALSFGGSPIRVEATGWGCVYFAEYMAHHHGKEIKGKRALISGAGNVAQYATEKLNELGAKVLTMSDSKGMIYDAQGIDLEKLKKIKHIKNEKRGSLADYAENNKCEYHQGKKPWGVEAELAFPCATQNEISKKDAQTLVKNGIELVSEGANMPSQLGAVEVFLENQILYGPGKAANAGGVAVSGLEQAQNSMRLSWSSHEVDGRLKNIMKEIHEKCVEHGKNGEFINYLQGSTIAAFIKVADAMLGQGVV